LIDDGDYRVKYARLNAYNEYYHLAGEQKYDMVYLKKALEKKNQNTLI
jgi:hypothetical protein